MMRKTCWSRLFGAGYLLAILGASLFSPHRHLNPLADLVSDGPSDSGEFLHVVEPSSGRRAALSEFVLVDDDPCLACFWHDFLAVTAIRFSLQIPASILPYASRSRAQEFLSVRERRSIIRGPPVSSI